MRVLLAVLLSLLALAPVRIASAAGGAHIVDDSEPEIPGTCHVESWTTLFLNGDGYANAAPACTTKQIPWLELGAAYQHYWGQPLNAPLFGPAIKVNFQSEKTGLGLGLGLTSEMNLRTGEVGLASTIGLMTIPLDDKVKLHLNAGWSYLGTADPTNALFYGGQFEIELGGDVMLMTEVFGRAPGFPGTQAGLRFTPDKGPIDFDLMVANYFDATSTRFITLGVTVRF